LCSAKAEEEKFTSHIKKTSNFRPHRKIPYSTWPDRRTQNCSGTKILDRYGAKEAVSGRSECIVCAK
jgi:hypothetical protein